MKTRALTKNQLVILNYIMVMVGSTLMAVSTYMFIVPAKLIPGGVTGIASFVETLFKFPAQYTIALANIPILLLALFVLERKLAIRTIFSILLVSGIMTIFSKIGVYRFDKLNQPLISAILSGSLSGLGVGLILNANATPGGTEVIGMLIQKKLRSTRIANILLAINVVVMSSGAILFMAVGKMNIDELVLLLVCSIIQVFIASKSIDMIVNGFNSAVKFEIITKNSEELCHAILKESEYGVTIIESKGAYLSEHNVILICVVPKLKIPRFKRIVQEHDPDAFMFSINTREVMGKNFKKTM